MQLELVSLPTATHPLEGLFYQPDGGATRGAALFMHGNCSNFYTGVMRFLPPALVALGYACFVFNRRGHDVIATFSRGAVGGAFQRVDEAIEDNRTATAWLATKGFTDPVVVGHSNGGMLAVRYAADHPRTPAVVLLSAHCGGKNLMPEASKAGLFAADRHAEFSERARALVAAGKERELMLLPAWYFAISAQTFVDNLDALPDVLALAPKIRCPVLYVRGAREPKDLYPAEAFAERAGGPCRAHIEPESDHYYTGRETSICRLVSSWLQQALPAAGARLEAAKPA